MSLTSRFALCAGGEGGAELAAKLDALQAAVARMEKMMEGLAPQGRSIAKQ